MAYIQRMRGRRRGLGGRHGSGAKALVAALALLVSTPAGAVEFGGVDFPEGAKSFADAVLRYDPLFLGGPAPTTPSMDPTTALGPPDFPGGDATFGYDVTLGVGGLLELLFLDNVLENSGTSADDLIVFEVGTNIEMSFMAVRPADQATADAIESMCVDVRPPFGDGFCEIGVGKTTFSNFTADLDSVFPGFEQGDLRFDAIQLVDDPEQGSVVVPGSPGADIDAVGALSSAEGGMVASIEEPTCVGSGGISNIRGLAYTLEDGEEIERLVRITFDEGTVFESSIDVPCCSTRGDAPVTLSGYSGIFNWCLLEPGLHTITVEFRSTSGATLTLMREFISFCEHPHDTFLRRDEFDWAGEGACASGADGTVVCHPAPSICDGEVRYEWSQASQGLALRSNCVADGHAPPASPACSNVVVEMRTAPD